jgi:MuDR family transposase
MNNELPPLTTDAVYDTIQRLKVTGKTHALARFFEFNTVKSDKRRYTIICKANNCHWRLHAISIENSKRFRVRTLSENHNCFDMNHVSYANASEDYIASIIKDKLEQQRTYDVKEIRRDILEKLRITISRSKAYRAHELTFKMIDGTYEGAHAKLSQYWSCHHLSAR